MSLQASGPGTETVLGLLCSRPLGETYVLSLTLGQQTTIGTLPELLSSGYNMEIPVSSNPFIRPPQPGESLVKALDVPSNELIC